MRRWLDFLFPLRADERTVRETSAEALLGARRQSPVARTSPPTVALLPFADARVRAAVHEAKYHGNARALELLSEVLAAHLSRIEEPHERLRLVPVPLGRTRLRERGFNQAEEIARRAGDRLRIPILDALLARTRETASQVSLSRIEREKNMRGAFALSHPASPDLTYILLDDVITTGATMQAAIDALASAGASRVLPVALAH